MPNWQKSFPRQHGPTDKYPTGSSGQPSQINTLPHYICQLRVSAQPSHCLLIETSKHPLEPSADMSPARKLRLAVLPQQPPSVMPHFVALSHAMDDVVLQFLWSLSDSWFTVPFPAGQSSDTQPYLQLKPIANCGLITTKALGLHWTTAIIQKLWNTAWDFLAHWNIDLP